MEIVEGDISRLEPIDPNEAEMQEDSKLYIAEFKNRTFQILVICRCVTF